MSVKRIEISEPFPKLLPNLKVFINHLNDCLENSRSLRELLGDFQKCDVVIAAFAVAFKSSIEKYDCSDEEIEVLAHVYAGFEGMGGVLSSIMCDMRDNDYECIIRDVEALAGQLKDTEAYLDKFNELKSAKPKLSEYANIDMVLKAGYAVSEGRRDWSFLVDRLSTLRSAFDDMTACDVLPDDLETYYDALDNLFRACEEQNADILPECLETLKASSDEVMEHYKNVGVSKKQNNASSGCSCLMCGSRFESYISVCPKCKSAIPENRFEDAVECSENELPASVQNIIYCIDAIRAGQDMTEALYESINAFMAEIEQRRHIYSQLPESYFDGSESETETLIASRDLLEAGFEKLENAAAVFCRLNEAGEDEIAAAVSDAAEGMSMTGNLERL